MTVDEALQKRRSVRGFLDTPVAVDRVRDLLIEAARAPSGGNLQPWHVDLVAGDAMKRLKGIMLARLASGEREAAQYDIYPKDLVAPYRDRRFAVGEAMYARLGIPREDKAGRMMWFARNFAFFGAPVAAFVSVDRRMGSPQWSDLGMFIQSFMLLATADGLATCAQECWAVWPDTVGAFIDLPPERMLFCGIAIGLEDSAAPANTLRSERVDASEWLRIVD